MHNCRDIQLSWGMLQQLVVILGPRRVFCESYLDYTAPTSLPRTDTVYSRESLLRTLSRTLCFSGANRRPGKASCKIPSFYQKNPIVSFHYGVTEVGSQVRSESKGISVRDEFLLRNTDAKLGGFFSNKRSSRKA